MASTFQQQAQRRKLLYFGLIVALFSFTLFLRHNTFAIEVPWDKSGEDGRPRLRPLGISPLAADLQIREQDLGEVQLTDSAINLTLGGLRGFAVCSLWLTAIEKQKKHEWNELELVVGVLTKLQPHFIKPWQFQSWNLAYNVSVESDRVKDKYFFVTRGIEMLAEGERRNRDNPDLRLDMGWYYQNKIGISDENTTMRSLFQLSCIPLKERDGPLFWKGGDPTRINLQKFRDFCRLHPHLVRRIREIPGCTTPEKIVEFLHDNRDVPCRYEDPDPVRPDAAPRLKPPYSRFPILPPESRFFGRAELSTDSPIPDDWDCWDVARAWFGYAQDPVDDPILKRKPRAIALRIFQGYPARAQFYRAEKLQEQGWFDRDGWTITDWFPADINSDGPPYQPETVGTDREWSREAWERAFQLYERHGYANGLLYRSPAELEANRSEYEYQRRLTNFGHFYEVSKVERLPAAIAARKLFFLADQVRKQADRRGALALYEHPDAFGKPETWDRPTGWKKLLSEHREFRRDSEIQDRNYQEQLKYLDLVRELYGIHYKPLLVVQDALAQAAAGQRAFAWLPPTCLARGFRVPIRGPLDGVDDEGVPYITPEAIHRVQTRMEALDPGRFKQ
jgi:hypothetical protein